MNPPNNSNYTKCPKGSYIPTVHMVLTGYNDELVTAGYEQNLERVRLYDNIGILTDTAIRDSVKHINWYALYPDNNEKPQE